ncbi:MAG: helix-turn-helix domain-containing protein [Bacteroidales bacterium]|nr:helix-turn-helix domain-containing protein [Bacteroidales bacterium]
MAVYLTIRSTENEGKSKYGWDKIARKLSISKQSVGESLKRLEELKVIQIKQEQSDKIDGVYNVYEFIDSGSFIAIRYDLLDKGLKGKILGILLYLQLQSDFDILPIEKQSELAVLLGCTDRTIRTYLKELQDYIKVKKGWIKLENIRCKFDEVHNPKAEKSVPILDIIL